MLANLPKRLRLSSVCFLLLSVITAFGQNVRPVGDAEARPLHLLVLGDSILWGQGLRDEHKSWYQVKVWLEKNTGRKVIERIEAHSGAVIQRSSLTDHLTSNNPEVNVGLPTISDELDDALKFYTDRSQVELVLLSGCGNDVGVQNLLDAENVGIVDDITDAQ